MCVSGRSAVRQDKVKAYINLESIQEPEDKNKKETHVT